MEEPAPKCKGCGEAILTQPIVQALSSDWHPKCFRCSSCGKRLSNWYIQNRGSLYCRRDYWSKFGDKCNGCSMVISGPVMVAGEHKYHPECFQCSACQTLIGDGEAYALVERSFLYCGQCYRGGPAKVPTSPQPLQQANTSPPAPSPSKTPRRKPHSIQMVEIPPTPELKQQLPHHPPRLQQPQQQQHGNRHHNRQKLPEQQQHQQQQQQEKGTTLASVPKRLHLSLKTIAPGSPTSGARSPGIFRNSFALEGGRMAPCVEISDLDSNSETFGLTVGDKIIEVNGTPVRDKTLEEINNLLTNYKLPVHVMLERDLSPLRLPPDEELTVSPALTRKIPSKGDSSEEPSSPSASEGETILVQDQPVRLRPKGSLKARGTSPSRRRSKSPSPCPTSRQKSVDLSRSHSFSTRQQDHRVFRAGDLIVGEVLGQGFFGQALKATHRVTGEKMVLKELHNFDEDAQKSFLREVSMLRNLSHPCVLRFMGVLYRDKKLNLVTEFIDGGTLSDLLLDQNVQISWKQRVAFAKDIAAGMNYLHSMDVIHRDLNSQNCLVRKDQTVVVADFGLAKIFPRQELAQISEKEKEGVSSSSSSLSGGRKKKKSSRRKRGTVVGNPYWMAPEMMTKGVYDEKVDVFSFGIIVCETIARVTADPDYLPRSIDFGLNVEAFYKRFCEGAPEPYVMLAVLCAQIEPDQRPSFEKIQVLCEALHLHVEHGMAVPAELQGSTVDFYRDLKEKMYGTNYKDADSCTQANTDKNKNLADEGVGSSSCGSGVKKDSVDSTGSGANLDITSDDGEAKSCSSGSRNSSGGDLHADFPLSDSSFSNAGEKSDCGLYSPVDQTTPSNHCEKSEKMENISSDSQNICTPTSTQSANDFLKGESNDLTMNMDEGMGESSIATTTNEDHAYFSCSSTSPSISPSSPCLSAEEFASCQSSPDASSESLPSMEVKSAEFSCQTMQVDRTPQSGTNDTTDSALPSSSSPGKGGDNSSSHSSHSELKSSSAASNNGTSMQLEYGEHALSPPPPSGSAKVGNAQNSVSSFPSSVSSSETSDIQNLPQKDQNCLQEDLPTSCSHMALNVPHQNLEQTSLGSTSLQGDLPSESLTKRRSNTDSSLGLTNKEKETDMIDFDLSGLSKLSNAKSASRLVRQRDIFLTAEDYLKPMDRLTVVTKENATVEGTDTFDGGSGSPITLSPNHEMGLSSSRSRLKRSMKNHQERDHSPLTDQS